VTARESARITRRAFAHPPLRRLQLGWAGAAIGQWAASIAVTVFAYAAGGAPAVALQLVMRMLPAAVAAPFMSTFADRTSRVRVMVLADATRVVVLLGMAALVAVDAPLIAVFVGSAVAGVLGTAFEPAKSALLPDLAREPDELTAANVVSNGIDSTSFFLGPGLAGLLLAVSSPEVVLVATALTFLWSALLIAGISEPARGSGATAGREGPADHGGEAPAPDEEHEPFLVAARAGFRTVAGVAPVRLIVALVAAQTFVDGLLATLVAALALDVLLIGDDGFGYLNAAIGVGGIIGAIGAVGLVGQRRLGLAFGVGCVFWGLPLALVGVVPEVAVAAVALAVIGVANTLVDVSAFTLLQRIAPPEVLGRVFGVLESMLLTTVALGAVTAPVLIELFGIEGALIASGAFLPVVVLLAAGGLRRLDATVDAAIPRDALALLRGIPLFAPLPPPVIERLASTAARVEVPAGAVVFAQGDPGDRFYAIASGRVEVEVDGRRVREQAAGDWFGEIALLRDVPRTASVRALEDLELVALERDDFVGAVSGHAPSTEAADTVISRRLVFARPAARGA
jgi:MFS family permease